MYQIFGYHQLSPQQLKAVQNLRESCKAQDGNDLPLYEYILEKQRAFIGDFLVYQNEKLIGFLGVFFFYHDACEIVILVHPEMRRMGIAKNLIAISRELIESREVRDVIISSPADVFRAYFLQKNYLYLYREYRMQWLPTSIPLLEVPIPDLTFNLATETNLEDLAILDEQCFNTLKSDAINRYQEILTNKSYVIIVVQKNNQVIGKIHFHFRESSLQLSDLAILPSWQKKGIGKSLLLYGLRNVAYSNNLPVYLEVNIKNEHALELYIQTGFTIINACDYWRISVKQFLQIS